MELDLLFPLRRRGSAFPRALRNRLKVSFGERCGRGDQQPSEALQRADSGLQNRAPARGMKYRC